MQGSAVAETCLGAVRLGCGYLQAQFHLLKSRRGAKKAAMAVAASILTAAYHILCDGAEYRDLGPEYFTRRDAQRTAHRLAHRIRLLGCQVGLQKVA